MKIGLMEIRQRIRWIGGGGQAQPSDVLMLKCAESEERRCGSPARVRQNAALVIHSNTVLNFDHQSRHFVPHFAGSAGQSRHCEGILSSWRWCPVFVGETTADQTTLSYFCLFLCPFTVLQIQWQQLIC